MKPVKLTMSAFGSYGGEETIDFSKADHGIYLITGETGAGKTTIFDAVSFALFGGTSGKKRDGTMMRSQFAPEDMDTFVRLVFREKGEIYEVTRSPAYVRRSRRRNKDGIYPEVSVPARAELRLPDGEVFPGNIRDINEKIKEILGVDQEQFAQTVMIAQGDYLQLLHASSRERKEIFSRIFDTGIYARIQSRLKAADQEVYTCLEDNRKLTMHELETMELPGESCFAGEWKELLGFSETGKEKFRTLLEKIRGETKRLREEAEEKRTKIRERISAAEKALETEKTRALLWQQREESKGRIKVLKSNLKETGEKQDAAAQILGEKNRESTEKLSALREEITRLQDILPLFEQWKAKRNQQERLRVQAERTEKEKQDTEEHRKQAQCRKEKLEQEIKELQQEAGRRELLLAQQEAAAQRMENLQMTRQKITDWRQVKKRWEESSRKTRILQERCLEAENAYREIYRTFLEEQAGILAEGLQEGVPCPVCGSVSHPKKQVRKHKDVDQRQVEQLRKARESAEKERQKQAEETVKLAQMCRSLEQQVRESGEGGDPEETWKLTGERMEELTREEKARSMALQETDRRMRKAKEKEVRLSETVEKMKEREAHLEELQKKLETEKEEWIQTAAQEAEMRRRLPKAGEEEVKKNLLDRKEAIRNLEEGCARAQREVEQWREHFRALQGKLEAEEENQRKQEALLAAIGEASPTDQGKLEQEIADGKQEEEQARSEERRLAEIAGRNEKAMETLEKLWEEREKLEEEYQLVHGLSQTANGKRSQSAGLDFQTFVQRQYFQKMVTAANRRLQVMADGRFLLSCRAVENLARRGEVGLDLDVYSMETGKIRDIRTLSGGESFMAALAMALGMADVIQNTAGHVQVDAIFLDEGFGTLDEEARLRAVQILRELAGKRAVIGIISHVRELQEQMGRKLVISRTESGSHTHWEIEE